MRYGLGATTCLDDPTVACTPQDIQQLQTQTAGVVNQANMLNQGGYTDLLQNWAAQAGIAQAQVANLTTWLWVAAGAGVLILFFSGGRRR